MTRYILLITFALMLFSCNINQDSFRVASNSMSFNYNDGDIVKIDKKVQDFNYADVIVCKFPLLYSDETGTGIIRIVGLPGDSIRIIYDICEINSQLNVSELIEKERFTEKGHIYNEYEETFPNGKKVRILHRPNFIYDDSVTATILVPLNHYFVMGDKRSDSYDSRYFGPISVDQIVGKVVKTTSSDK